MENEKIKLGEGIEITPNKKPKNIVGLKMNDNNKTDETLKITRSNILGDSLEKEFQQKQTINKQKVGATKVIKTPILENKKIQKENLKLKKVYPKKTIRTYRDDVVNVLKSQKISLTKMVMEDKKNRKKNRKKENKKPTLTIFLSFLIVLIIGLSGFFLIGTQKNNDIPKEVRELSLPNIIFPNYQREVFLSSLRKKVIINSINKEKNNINIPLGSIMQLYLTKEDPSKQFVVEKTGGNKLLITTEVFFKSLETKVSTKLTRSLESNFMFGYHSSLGNNPFLIFKVKSYNNVFAEMLNWEKTMVSDLFTIFERENSKIDKNSNNFKDVVVVNKDVRVILNMEGKVEFAYSFPDRNTLIITNNETTLKEIFRRLSVANLERQD